MVSKISCLIIFGIIIFTNGNPVYRQDSYHEEPQYDLKKLISELPKQGKYDVMLIHHEDRPGTHHEDTKKITYNGGKPNYHYYNEENRNAESYQGVRGKNSYYNTKPPSVQNLNLFLRNKLGTQKTKKNNDDTKDCMKKWGTCTELVWNFTDTKTSTRSSIGQGQEDDDTDTRNNSVNEDVLKLLNDLDKSLKLDGNNDIELRCYGTGCDVNRVDDNRNNDRDDSGNRDYNYNIIDDNYDRQLRCNGKRCSIHREYDDKNNLRCYGNRCSIKTNDRDDDGNDVRINEDDFNKEINRILRSIRDESDRNSIDFFRCIGDRCSRNRNDNDRRDTLRCIGDRCSRDRDGRGDRYDGKDDRSRLRCVGDKCGRNTDDNESGIYCTGNRCGRSRPAKRTEYSKSNKDNVREETDKLFQSLLEKDVTAFTKNLEKSYSVLRNGVFEIIQNMHVTTEKPKRTKRIIIKQHHNKHRNENRIGGRI